MPCSKDNVSWGEYQMTIPVTGSTAPIAVVLTFDAETTIVRTLRITYNIQYNIISTQGSCHSNCQDISCSGSTCTLTYQSSSNPLQMFNIRKTNAAGDSDRCVDIIIIIYISIVISSMYLGDIMSPCSRSNLLSVTLNGVEQC